MNESEIFNVAAGLPPERRGVYLDDVCGGDSKKRDEIESLLRADGEADSFLEKPAMQIGETEAHQPITEGPGSLIGRYRLMEQIGEGGFGLVFVAEQTEPVRRKVALKIIKPGMDTKEVIARFEAERQALALMDHPNIAKVHDAGTTESGRPYFVMELIKGQPITDYCDAKKLTVRERLALFTFVCHAVQHAHQKGIIHRDIKPNNVLVTEIDGEAMPKVIDFGVAKALSTRLTDQTIYTGFQSIMGTPLYMSPEQAKLSGVDVDTRSDIYSLGVLLYELLTGQPPFDRKRLTQAALDEVCRIIREEDRPTPRARLSTLGATAETVSADRRTDMASLGRLIRGDVELIVMKAIDKDRNRRYETANGLATDVRRYLNDEAIEARPPSNAYLLRKIFSRNKTLLGTSMVLLAALSISMAGLWIGWRKSVANADRLQKTADRLQKTSDELGDVMTGTILNFALTGETEAAMVALSTARNSEFGFDESLLLALEGMIHLYSDDPKKALEFLKKATDRDPNSFAGWAATFIVTNHLGDYGKKSDALRRIVDVKPRTAAEKLFYCQVRERSEPETVDKMLTEVLKSQPLWGAAHQLRGRARMVLVMDEFDRPGAVQRIEAALSDFEDANQLSSAELTRTQYLFALIQAAEFARDASLDDQAKKWTDQADEIALSLGPVTKTIEGDSFVAKTSLLALKNDQDALRTVWKIVLERSPTQIWGAELFAKGRMAELKEYVDKIEESGTIWPAVVEMYYLADTAATDADRLKAIKAVYESTFGCTEYATDDHWVASDVYLLLGRPDLARDEAKRTLEKPNLISETWLRRCLEYLAEPTPSAEANFIKAAGPFGDRLVSANYHIGMVALANGNRQKARDHFDKIEHYGRMDWWSTAWGYAFNERLRKDPKWPYWIPNLEAE
ncbi:serine/threonine protein kinase [Novipirellula artificiosorum]|uniref:Serine/threonine-protein kinase PrkC n=1 Tax=Novipirellula artificiosorum TaxID=2528016 RepID=A0A5C6CWK4_9BACT|nr:serine/threonine-protein kinase [Novipirellula artificiosorum]TWU28788.1 Serine/threonine-protein kinase PrkC [Novipirellula artificiosorum]